MDTTHIQPSPDSPFLAYGKVAPSRQRWLWISALILLGAFCALLVGFFLLLNRPVAIPHRTALLISVSPKQAQEIPAWVQKEFPESWRSALNGNARWPSVLGAYRTESGWKSFAITPTWYGSNRILSDQVLPRETRDFRYLSALRWNVWMDPQLLFLETTDSNLGLEPFTARRKGYALETSIRMNKTTDTRIAPTYADVSLNLASIPTMVNAIGLLPEFPTLLSAINESGAEPTSLALLPSVSGTGLGLNMSFREPLAEEQAAILLGALGVHERKAKTLSDGVVVSEFIRLSTASGTLFGERENENGQFINLEPTKLSYGMVKADLAPVSSRCVGHSLLFVSGLTVKKTLESVGAISQSFESHGISLIEASNKLLICFE